MATICSPNLMLNRDILKFVAFDSMPENTEDMNFSLLGQIIVNRVISFDRVIPSANDLNHKCHELKFEPYLCQTF